MGMKILLAVAFGGAAGATGRFLLSTWVQRMAGETFPYGTLSVNVLGSFLRSLLFLFFEQAIAPAQKAFLVTGMLGALTTFSTFSLESVLMIQEGMLGRAVLNISLNTLVCIAATVAGMMVFRRLYGF